MIISIRNAQLQCAQWNLEYMYKSVKKFNDSVIYIRY